MVTALVVNNFYLAHGIKQFDSSFAWQQSVIEHVQIETERASLQAVTNITSRQFSVPVILIP